MLFALSHGRRALMSVAQPALGALLAAGAFPSPHVTILGIVAATAGIFCVYAANDLLDRQVDREAARRDGAVSLTSLLAHPASVRRPLARGLISDRLAAGWVAGLGLVALAAAYLLRPGCALIFGLCVMLEALYCSLRRRSWLKTLAAGVLVGLGGLAGWYTVRGLDAGAVALFALLALWEIFGRNLANDLADLAEDGPLGIRTLATTHGPRASAVACLAGALVILPVAVLQPASALLRALLVVAAVWSMTLPAFRLARHPESAMAQWYFDRATLFPPLAFALACAVVILQGAT